MCPEKKGERTILKGSSGNSLGKVLPDLCLLDFRVEDVDECFLRQEVAN